MEPVPIPSDHLPTPTSPSTLSNSPITPASTSFLPNACEDLHQALAASYFSKLPYKLAREHKGKRNEIFAEDYNTDYLSYAEGQARKQQKEALGFSPKADDLLVIHLEPTSPPPLPTPPTSPPALSPARSSRRSSSSRRKSIHSLTSGLKKLILHRSKGKEKSADDLPSPPCSAPPTSFRRCSTEINIRRVGVVFTDPWVHTFMKEAFKSQTTLPVLESLKQESDDELYPDSEVFEPHSTYQGEGVSEYYWDSDVCEPDSSDQGDAASERSLHIKMPSSDNKPG